MKKFLTRTVWMLLFLLFIVAIWQVDADWKKLADLPSGIVKYTGLMFGPPELSVFGESLSAMVDSIQMAWVGTVLAALIAMPLQFLAANNLVPRPVSFVTRAIFSLDRAVPEVILAVLILTITGLSPFTGALAIGIHSAGTLGKLGAEAIEDVDKGPIEAAEAGGLTWLQKIRVAVWPSVAPQVLSVWLYRFEVNVRASAVLGLIGAGGIGSLISSYISYRRFPEIGTMLIVLIVGTMLVDMASGAVRTKLVTGRWPWWKLMRRFSN